MMIVLWISFLLTLCWALWVIYKDIDRHSKFQRIPEVVREQRALIKDIIRGHADLTKDFDEVSFSDHELALVMGDDPFDLYSRNIRAALRNEGVLR